jgi:L-threonylcarbamoyladenylate synthase
MPIGKDVELAARLLRQGEAVAIPTETVYGLAANAFDERAVLKIYQAKQRPSFDPLIVHVHHRDQIGKLATELPPGAEALMERFWPGPLTFVLPKTNHVPDLVTSGLDTVAVRMPAHPVARQLLQQLDFPLAAPSANPFGYVSPTTAQHVADQLGAKIPYILDGGPCAVGVESTIIGWDVAALRWLLYRAGGTPQEAIERVIGPLAAPQQGPKPASPGMLESHYAPGKPVFIGDLETLIKEHRLQSPGVISFRQDHGAPFNEVLSPTGDMEEAARNLFAALRRLDRSEAGVILAEPFPRHGLGAAINDRLKRAAAKRV